MVEVLIEKETIDYDELSRMRDRQLLRASSEAEARLSESAAA